MLSTRSNVVLLAIAAVLTLTAGQCNGVVTNLPPSLSNIGDRRAPSGDTIEVPFTIADEDPASVSVTASSDDPTLVADVDLEVVGSGADRVLYVTPTLPGVGTAGIGLVARDVGGLEASGGFTLTVTLPFDRQLPKLASSGAAEGGGFGASVAISGDYAIIGAPFSDYIDIGFLNFDSGSAYVFERDGDTWTEVDMLLASDGATEDWFGFSVAISGDYAFVGSVGSGPTGSAYVFKRNDDAWVELTKLAPSDASVGQAFGNAVSVSGDYAIIGSWQDDDLGPATGSAYVFKRSGDSWTEVAKLSASDAAAHDWFGRSVDISGDCVIIGGPHSGSAYVFERSGGAWIEAARLTADDAAVGSTFGWEVALDGEYAVIGHWPDNEFGSGSGSAYVFRRQGGAWVEVIRLTASDAAAHDGFGDAVAIGGDYAIIGAELDDDAGLNSGSAYIFMK